MDKKRDIIDALDETLEAVERLQCLVESVYDVFLLIHFSPPVGVNAPARHNGMLCCMST